MMMSKEIVSNAANGDSFDSVEAIRALSVRSLYLEKLLRQVHPGLFGEQAQPAGIVDDLLDGAADIKVRVMAEIRQGVSEKAVEILQRVGLWDYDTLCVAKEEDLLAVRGIGPSTVKVIRAAVGG